MEQVAAEVRRTDVLVAGTRVLLRASLMGLLEPWAAKHRVRLVDQPPEALRGIEAPPAGWALGVLSLGGCSLAEALVSGWLVDAMRLLEKAPAVILSDRDDPAEAVAALQAGARGFIPTTTEPSIALQALTFIMGGGSYFPPGALLRRGGARPPRGMPHDPASARQFQSLPLTMRQQAVLTHLQAGEPNKVIARALMLREATVKVHVGQILRKLGAANRTQVALSIHSVAGLTPITAALPVPLPGTTLHLPLLPRPR